MASVQTPVRQPFGVLDGTKLRSIQSVKNRQNAIAPSSAPSLKRRHVTLELSDSENVDPVEAKASAPKRKKADTEESLCKPSTFTARPFSKPKQRISSSSVFTPRPETPTVNATVKPPVISSAPAAAGRSPPRSKPPGILSSRRTRLNAPVFGSRSRAPLSLAAALNGTLSSKKHKSCTNTILLEESKPKAWFFDIYEETPEEHCLNTVIRSTDSFNISSNKGETAAARRESEKENIPPSELQHTATVTGQANTKKDMIEGPRTPLGDLNPSDYYAAGCDATSIALINEDEDTTGPAAEQPAADDFSKSHTLSTDFNFHIDPPAAGSEAHDDKTMTKSELHTLLLNAGPALLPTDQHDVEAAGLFDCGNNNNTYNDADDGNDSDIENVQPAEIEIWESGSAKDEAADAQETAESIFAEL